MITIVPAPDNYEDLKPGEACIIAIDENRNSLAFRCPTCNKVFVPAGPRHQYNAVTNSITPSVVHQECGFHKTLTNGEWH